MTDPSDTTTHHKVSVEVPRPEVVDVRVFYGSREVHAFEFDTTGLPPDRVARSAAETAFERLNIAHPPGWPHRSMSVGDLVVVGEVVLACAPVGWEVVPADQLADLFRSGGRHE